MTTLRTSLLLLLCAAASMPLRATERRRSIAPMERALTIEFVQGPASQTPLLAAGSDGWLDVKTINQRSRPDARMVSTRRQFGVRIVRVAGGSSGTVIITARLDGFDGRTSVRIDGRALTTVPTVISERAVVGVVTMHTLEIEVPDSAPAGQLAASISWEATTQ